MKVRNVVCGLEADFAGDETIESHLEAMLEVGEPIPTPISDVDFVELETVA
jgi:hypothetical protein